MKKHAVQKLLIVEKSNDIQELRHIEQCLFKSIDIHNTGTILKSDLINGLDKVGILINDPRITSLAKYLNKLPSESQKLDFNDFCSAISGCAVLIEKSLKAKLIIPDFSDFKKDILSIYNDVKKNTEGKVASYIPQLAKVAPDKFGVSICTIDGQSFSIGDSKDYFSIQSISKPITYCLALETFDEDIVHNHVGREPSGSEFNAITLDSKNRPHNPMINAGAIMSCSMIKAQSNPAERFDYVISIWDKLSATTELKPTFNNTVYLSEKRTADRNFSLTYFMSEKKKFPENTNLMETLDLYFQCCSIELTCDAMAVVAATLANSGINPFSGERILNENTVKHCLSLMYSCGMYDFSGEFAFTIGIPAKSGVGGGLMLVIPNVMGICVWSPPLDQNGNSVKGVHFSRELVKKFNFHNYDSLVSINSGKKDPRNRKVEVKLDTIGALCWAASQGDLGEVKHLIARGVNINDADYDGRTPLHLAASEGHYSVVEALIQQGASPCAKDRWGNTPIEDAQRCHHKEIVSFMQVRNSAEPIQMQH